VLLGWLAPLVAGFAKFEFPNPDGPYHIEAWRKTLVMVACGPGIVVAWLTRMGGGLWTALVLFAFSAAVWALVGTGLGWLYGRLRARRSPGVETPG
jgi:hypothetical protein